MFGATELMEGGRILADIGVSLVMSDYFRRRWPQVSGRNVVM
jgi:hypothetical protein